MPSENDEARERRAFEAWARSTGREPIRMDAPGMPEHHLYAALATQAAWEAWQVRGDLSQRPAPAQTSDGEGARERLVAFLYILTRDEITTGALERILRDHVTGSGSVFCSRHCEAWAREFAYRLLGRVE